MPVHIGLTSMQAVDVEVTRMVAGRRVTTIVRRVSPAEYAGRSLVVPARAGTTPDTPVPLRRRSTFDAVPMSWSPRD
jgi:hypothetical protein